MTKRKIEYWVIPPDQDAEFVANMEDVLETYAQTYDPQQPVMCMDEQPVQLLKETKVPIGATKEHGKRVDYEYERNGTASIFLFAEPLSGFRQATAREQRTKVDWAIEVAHLLATPGTIVVVHHPSLWLSYRAVRRTPPATPDAHPRTLYPASLGPTLPLYPPRRRRRSPQQPANRRRTGL